MRYLAEKLAKPRYHQINIHMLKQYQADSVPHTAPDSQQIPGDLSLRQKLAVMEQLLNKQHRRIRQLEADLHQVSNHLRSLDK